MKRLFLRVSRIRSPSVSQGVLSKSLGTVTPPFFAEDKLGIHDPVYGQVELNTRLKHIIDTPYFQRLREIKQLGATCYVYPSATHTRFEHSLGTAFLAEKMLQSLWIATARDTTSQTHQLNEKDYLCVIIAALCHDIGHGPFSHLFDRLFLKRLRSDAKPTDRRLWEHEGRSMEILKILMKDEGLQEKLDLEDHHLHVICKMMTSPPKFENPWTDDLVLPKEKGYLFEIVTNKINEIDVDKIDYILRDSQALKLSEGFKWKRYFKNIKVLQVPITTGGFRNQICSRLKETHNLYDLFHLRMMMHKRAYQHKTTTAIQLMMADALLLANNSVHVRGGDGTYYSLGRSASDTHAFLRLTDSIQQIILNTPTAVSHEQNRHTDSYEPMIRRLNTPIYTTPSSLVNEAKEIFSRIERRSLYTCLGHASVPLDKHKTGDECAQDVMQYFYESVPELKEFDNPRQSLSEIQDPIYCPSKALHVYVTAFGYPSKDPNASPLKHHYVYEKHSPECPQPMETIPGVQLQKSNLEREIYVYFRPQLVLAGNNRLVTKLRWHFREFKQNMNL